MTATLEQIRPRLVDQVSQHMRCTGHVFPPAQLRPPCVFIGSVTKAPASMGGSDDLSCSLYYMVRAGSDPNIEALDAAIDGPMSMGAAIDIDPTLGLSGVNVTFDEAGKYGLHDWAGAQFWGVVLDLVVMRD